MPAPVQLHVLRKTGKHDGGIHRGHASEIIQSREPRRQPTTVLCGPEQIRHEVEPGKCIFIVPLREFLGYIVTNRGIESNPRKIAAILELMSPKNTREVQ